MLIGGGSGGTAPAIGGGGGTAPAIGGGASGAPLAAAGSSAIPPASALVSGASSRPVRQCKYACARPAGELHVGQRSHYMLARIQVPGGCAPGIDLSLISSSLTSISSRCIF